MKFKTHLIIGLSFFLSGCSGWLADRGRDFMDVGTLTLEAGLGLGFHAQMTDLARLSLEYKKPWRFGASGRVAGLWFEDRMSWALGPFGMSQHELLEIYCLGNDHWNEYADRNLWPSMARVFVQQRYYLSGQGVRGQIRDRQITDVGYSLHLGLIGTSHDFRPLEVIDFVLGFFGIDFADDDIAKSRWSNDSDTVSNMRSP